MLFLSTRLLFLICTELYELDVEDSSVSEGFLGTAKHQPTHGTL